MPTVTVKGQVLWLFCFWTHECSMCLHAVSAVQDIIRVPWQYLVGECDLVGERRLGLHQRLVRLVGQGTPWCGDGAWLHMLLLLRTARGCTERTRVCMS